MLFSRRSCECDKHVTQETRAWGERALCVRRLYERARVDTRNDARHNVSNLFESTRTRTHAQTYRTHSGPTRPPDANCAEFAKYFTSNSPRITRIHGRACVYVCMSRQTRERALIAIVWRCLGRGNGGGVVIYGGVAGEFFLHQPEKLLLNLNACVRAREREHTQFMYNDFFVFMSLGCLRPFSREFGECDVILTSSQHKYLCVCVLCCACLHACVCVCASHYMRDKFGSGFASAPACSPRHDA